MSSVKQTEQGAYLTLDPERTKAIMASLEQEVAKLENMGKNSDRYHFTDCPYVF